MHLNLIRTMLSGVHLEYLKRIKYVNPLKNPEINVVLETQMILFGNKNLPVRTLNNFKIVLNQLSEDIIGFRFHLIQFW